MRRLTKDTYADIVAYNLRDHGTAHTHFDAAQPQRVGFARGLIRDIVAEEGGRRLRIVEPGCSTGDISGFFAADHDVLGIDIVPAAVEAARLKWPGMDVVNGAVEDWAPVACDVLVLCEFLEHVIDPIQLVSEWGPVAGHIVVGHPLVGSGSDPERGHVWAYEASDFADWFGIAGHEMVEAWEFDMGYRMVIGRGRRL